MREQSIVVEGSNFIKLSDWALEACKGNEAGAKMLAIFLFHYDNRFANKILVELILRAIKNHGKNLKWLDDWLPYSWAYLRELTFATVGRNQLMEGARVLNEIGFVSDDIPDSLKDLYSKSHSWYKLNIEAIRDWRDSVYYPNKTKMMVIHGDTRQTVENIAGADPATKPVVAVRPKLSEAKEKLNKMVDALYRFYRHIHAKDARFVFDEKRRAIVVDQVKERVKSFGEQAGFAQCCLAIIGNRLSDFHQGANAENKIYDDIGSNIFKNASKFELMCSRAEEKDVTEEKAFAEFQKFMNNQRSIYAKGQKEIAPEMKAIGLDPDTKRKYKAFAFSFVGYFKGGTVSNEGIMDLIKSNHSLREQAEIIVDKDAFFEILKDAGKVKIDADLPEKIINQMKDFVDNFKV